MKIAIIGGSSFIGQNLLSFLTKKKYKIISTYTNNSEIKNEFPGIKWKKLDISKNKKNFFKFLEFPDILINLSWPDIPDYKTKKHFKTFYYQKRFNYNLINNGLKNLIVMGTCYEYGKRNGKINESFIAKPIIPYAISKLKLLESILHLKKKRNFKFTWLRPFFVYGLNKKRKTLFSIIKEIDKGKQIKISVPGKLNRDFIPIEYLSFVIYKIFKLNRDIGILNVCSGKKKSIKEFIFENLNHKNKINKIDMNGKNPNSFEPLSFWGSTLKLKRILNVKKISNAK